MLIVGIAGGSGSGKTTVVMKIVNRFHGNQIAVIQQDSYYRDNSHIPLEERQHINFDHPAAIEFELLCSHIQKLKQGKFIERPVYSFLTCTRSEETIRVEPADILILEGILILSDASLRKLIDIKVFIDADPDDMLRRVITRDISERGRSAGQVLERYEKTVKPMYIQFIEPTKQYADIIIHHSGDDHTAMDMLASIIEKNFAR
jgi:uridine kinase